MSIRYAQHLLTTHVHDCLQDGTSTSCSLSHARLPGATAGTVLLSHGVHMCTVTLWTGRLHNVVGHVAAALSQNRERERLSKQNSSCALRICP